MHLTTNYRRHSTYESAQSAKPAQSALFAAKLLPNLPKRATGLVVWDQPFPLLPGAAQNTLLWRGRAIALQLGDGWATRGSAPDREERDLVRNRWPRTYPLNTKGLLWSNAKLLQWGRQHAAKSVNAVLTATYWSLHRKSLRGLAPPGCTNLPSPNSNQMCKKSWTLPSVEPKTHLVYFPLQDIGGHDENIERISQRRKIEQIHIPELSLSF